MQEKAILQAFELATEVYASYGVDVEAAMDAAKTVPISMHCWQGDDVVGLEGGGALSGGIATTGNYPGKSRTAGELRSDISKALDMIPGKKKINLHAIYAEPGGKKIDRDGYTAEEFAGWIQWGKEKGLGFDFNPTFFSHPMMDGDFSLASADEGKRRFWVEHGKRCREIGEAMGKALGEVCVVNFWMPDGYKDKPVDTLAPRERMMRSLDEIFERPIDPAHALDAVESKLFGLGIESYTVASHEFALAYAITHGKLYCLDEGHFHPTEVVSAKLSAIMPFLQNALLHISRGVRWDSDHVVLWDDELHALFSELVRNQYLSRVFIALDYFDASINRVCAWVVGMRNAQKALLNALLEPVQMLRKAESSGDYSARLALLEETKTLPFGPVWDAYCLRQNVPVGSAWLQEVRTYERDVLLKR